MDDMDWSADATPIASTTEMHGAEGPDEPSHNQVLAVRMHPCQSETGTLNEIALASAYFSTAPSEASLTNSDDSSQIFSTVTGFPHQPRFRPRDGDFFQIGCVFALRRRVKDSQRLVTAAEFPGAHRTQQGDADSMFDGICKMVVIEEGKERCLALRVKPCELAQLRSTDAAGARVKAHALLVPRGSSLPSAAPGLG